MPQMKGDDEFDAWCHRGRLIDNRWRRRWLIDDRRWGWRNDDRRRCCFIDDRGRTLTLIGVMLAPLAPLGSDQSNGCAGTSLASNTTRRRGRYARPAH